ncbi:putative toxin-antitoxin system antitoxin component (TIGR02293 family) [Paucibacter oligotrophus]|uniref:Putative toxin-antitoxin system antitoxin component (TIGR02293 family) n=1 Tax=Roseateles oligotrophus TaxID=1769250 RepID=A0A840L9W7_9BURK|nr:antitoxin Xre/MbcA/ParS toxin-binding domain-containing protein [Roseateles oligotrophus]MBB4843555.1 putative toxin-antitoxin system antitoxin component (TIGR02293 family) [Roseateles oligotrophus]
MPALQSHPATRGKARSASDFWVVSVKGRQSDPRFRRSAFNDLVGRVMSSPGVALFDAVEVGVPTYLVDVIAGATGLAASSVMDMIGVSATTFRRKDGAGDPLPDVAGHRVMGFLRIAATLRRLLEESGDPAQLRDFDLDAWLAQWMREELPELGGKTPAEMLRNHEGLRAVEQVLGRMRGGLPA